MLIPLRLRTVSERPTAGKKDTAQRCVTDIIVQAQGRGLQRVGPALRQLFRPLLKRLHFQGAFQGHVVRPPDQFQPYRLQCITKRRWSTYQPAPLLLRHPDCFPSPLPGHPAFDSISTSSRVILEEPVHVALPVGRLQPEEVGQGRSVGCCPDEKAGRQLRAGCSGLKAGGGDHHGPRYAPGHAHWARPNPSAGWVRPPGTHYPDGLLGRRPWTDAGVRVPRREGTG